MPQSVALQHRTWYEYDRPVMLGPQIVRLRPAPHGRTPIGDYALQLRPQPHLLHWQQDVQANMVARVAFPERVARFEITVDLTADLSVINPFDFLVDATAECWPFAYDAADAAALAPFLHVEPGGPYLNAFLATLPRGRQRSSDLLVALNGHVRAAIAYVTRHEPGVWDAERTLAERRGSCRDSAWLLVRVLRHRGIAARFVSGYLIQLANPAVPDAPAADGAELHAWAEAYLPGAGWIGLDATSGLLAGEGHIPLAVGPMPGAAAPISGTAEPSEVTFGFTMQVRRLTSAAPALPLHAPDISLVAAASPPDRRASRPAPGPQGSGPVAVDEMVDGDGGLRPHWQRLVGALSGLGHDMLADRGARLARAFAEEGITGPMPGGEPGHWRCDPVPLLLPGAEFEQLQAGLGQRARLLDAILGDLYGPQTLLAQGRLPPALVFPDPNFLRPCRLPAGRQPGPLLHFYAADLVRDADRRWRVLADHVDGTSGIARALENRRMMARVLPELFPPDQVAQLRPFFDRWQDALQRLVPPDMPSGAPGGIALLTGGHADPMWFEHVLLSRELGCALVEGADLTVRDGQVLLKTLHGLQRIAVLLRRMKGELIDPLELHGDVGVPGLIEAMRTGAVRIVNHPGTALAKNAALPAFLPTLADHLLGEPLVLPSVDTVWLGEDAARARVAADPAGWLVRGGQGCIHDIMGGGTATRRIAGSVAPCAGPAGLDPRPIVLRMFLLFDGTDWQAMPGGLAQVRPDDEPATRLPRHGLAKDVWVMRDEGTDRGPAVPALAQAAPVRRSAGDLPSRVADNFFWFGRYLERVEGAARLQRAVITRLSRTALLPREVAELQVPLACLVQAGVIGPEALDSTSPALLRAEIGRAANDGALIALLGRVSDAAEALRDRLTGDMYATIVASLRNLLAQLQAAQRGGSGDDLAHAMTGVLHFTATVAGFAAENMVRGGGRLFLDLGRRVERAQAVASLMARTLGVAAGPQGGSGGASGRMEAGLRMALELCDSVITYRSRYLATLQPALVLDLVLADSGNPRSLAHQLAASRDLLAEIAGDREAAPSRLAGALLAELCTLVGGVAGARDQTAAALALGPNLRVIEDEMAGLSDSIGRMYFALLPPKHAMGAEPIGAAARPRDLAEEA